MSLPAPKRRRTSPATKDDEDDQAISSQAEEPELPPTPDHRDPVVSTPPSGIHNTPSKRHKSKKVDSLFSSPSRRKLRQPTKDDADLGTGVVTPLEQLELECIYDPRVSWKKQLDWLHKQAEQASHDIALANATIARLVRDSRGEKQTFETNELVGLLQRHLFTSPHEDAVSEPQSQFLGLFGLEFTNDHDDAAEPSSAQVILPGFNDSQSTHRLGPNNEMLPEPKSHHPLRLTAAEAKPFLQSFSPLEFTGNYLGASQFAGVELFPDPGGVFNPDVLHHDIQVSAQPPFGDPFFSAKIHADVNVNTLLVEAVSVDHISGCANELTPLMNSICHAEKNRTSIVKRNLGVLGWGMAEWLRVAVRRAMFWKTLDDELVGDSNVAEMVRECRAGKRKRGRGRKEPSLVLADTEYMGVVSREYEIPVLSPQPLFLGGHFETTTPATLCVGWRIEFDWTGHARSDITLKVNVPEKWREFDTRGTLSTFSEVFQVLLSRGQDPVDAVRETVAWLAGPELVKLTGT
ncbi:hypothetical protein V8F33_009614 [Rhypophila sp. PSN 637]